MDNTAELPQFRDFLAPQRTEVLQVRRESHDTVSLQLALPPNFARWHPGQFNMLYLFGLGEVPISISGELAGAATLTHTIKAVGVVSRALTELTAGDTVWIRGPYGSVWPQATSAGTLLLVAGGIGLAPLRPVVLSARHHHPLSRIIVIYGARTPEDVLFGDDLAQWSSQAATSVHVTVDRVGPGSSWNGAVGVVTHLLHHLPLDPQTTTALCCGPEIMLRHVVGDLASMGIADEHIYVSLERNMKCAVGLCGRCQWGQHFICRDGPVYQMKSIRPLWSIKDF